VNKTEEVKLGGIDKESRTKQIYEEQLLILAKRTDKMFAGLMILQWLGTIAAAYFISPLTWEGTSSYTHPHLTYALWLGGLLTAIPVYFAIFHSGSIITRHVIAVAQMLMSGLMIDISGGRIETHFHIFGSLALLAFYRDWKVLVSATVVTAALHIWGSVGGELGARTMYGVAAVSPWRWVEHALWVVFEDVFLIIASVQGLGDIQANATKQASLEEAGDLTRTLNQLAAAKKELIDQADEIANVVEVLYSSGARISEALSELASNAQETLSAVTETTTIVEQVRQTAEVSSHKARKVAEDAQVVLQISERGQKATDQTVDGMKHIRDQMGAIADGMFKLSNQSNLIGEIIAAVDDLAQQSNLLSVNASIEAAKAGEYGRGFAVVAQDVKNLSKESKEATAHVRSILNEIVNATASATMSTELGSKAVAAGEDVVKQARESILALSESIVDASQTSGQIEVSSQQQLVGMQQVVAAMESVKEASNHNVKSVRELEQAVNNLNDLGKQLKVLVERSSHNGQSEPALVGA